MFQVRGCKPAAQVKLGFAVMFCSADIAFKKKKIVISCQCLRKRNFTIKLGLENPFLKTKNVAILSSCFPMEIISGGEERQPLLDRPLLFHLP